jgi:asparagine synthase (glutamine-hydrolysing)
MCGLLLVYTPHQPTAAGTVQAMAHTLRHRGPDGEGYVGVMPEGPVVMAGRDTPEAVVAALSASRQQAVPRVDAQAERSAPLWLAHRRLAILDLSPLGHQPMADARERYWAVYNGEVYNHLELRAELEALGHRFASHSDTEVLLAAYAQWGAQALSRFNGMWALVIYDHRRRTLFIARDRFGVKPLYVWRGPQGALMLASEIKALLAHPLVKAAPQIDECLDFVRQGPQAWREATAFEGITRFPAGHWAEVALDAPVPLLRPQAYWQHPQAPEGAEHHTFSAARAAQHVERYRELLADAVRLRLRADVRTGTALSGGLDSSSIALLVNNALRERGATERQEVFSSVYKKAQQAGVDESAFIERVAQQLGVRSNQIEAQAADVPFEHERMVWALDTPAANTLMSSWHTFKLVAERGVVVTLDGQGADEQLAGYARYTRNRLVHQGLRSALREAWATARGMQGFAAHIGVGLAGQLLRRVLGTAGLAGLVRRLGMGSDPSLTLAQALQHDFGHNLQNLLLYADKTAMAWSVESRMPFMDYRLVEFIASVEPAYKLHGGWTKWLGRSAMQGRLPDAVVWRQDKMGWPIPEQEWFAGPLKGWLAAQLQRSEFVQAMAAQAGVPVAGAGLAQQLRLLNLATWHRIYFEEPGRPGRVLGRTPL